ncbi:hypothetical protein TeGR_g4795, partial [Tetraparma gracilis]
VLTDTKGTCKVSEDAVAASERQKSTGGKGVSIPSPAGLRKAIESAPKDVTKTEQAQRSSERKLTNNGGVPVSPPGGTMAGPELGSAGGGPRAVPPLPHRGGGKAPPALESGDVDPADQPLVGDLADAPRSVGAMRLFGGGRARVEEEGEEDALEEEEEGEDPDWWIKMGREERPNFMISELGCDA